MGDLSSRIFMIGLLFALFAICIVFLVEQVLQPSYFVKSAVKVAVFSGSIFGFSKCSKRKLGDVIRFHKMKKIWILVLCMVLSYLLTSILFFLFRNQLDLSSIRESLMTKEKLTPKNCLFVFGYIVFVNAFLEEAFFRGFVFQLFKNKKVGMTIGAFLFSVYHIGIFITWFNPFVFILCLIGLFLVGVMLQLVNLKFNSIFAGYMIHAAANVMINGIGALLILNAIH